MLDIRQSVFLINNVFDFKTCSLELCSLSLLLIKGSDSIEICSNFLVRDLDIGRGFQSERFIKLVLTVAARRTVMFAGHIEGEVISVYTVKLIFDDYNLVESSCPPLVVMSQQEDDTSPLGQ